MARVKGGTVARARRKKVLKEAKGYFGSKHRLFKTAHEQVMNSGEYAYRDRRQNKRNFRKLWIARINAACRENDISYSRFINGLNKAGVTINRKMLSELAIDNKEAFKDLVVISKDALNGKAYTPKTVNLAKEDAKVTAKESEKKVEKKTAKPAAKATTKTTTKKTTTKDAEKKEPAKKPATKTASKSATKSTTKAVTKKAETKPTAKKTTTAKKVEK